MRRVLVALTLVGIAVSIQGCACRPGYVGPYGGVRPARCWIW